MKKRSAISTFEAANIQEQLNAISVLGIAQYNSLNKPNNQIGTTPRIARSYLKSLFPILTKQSRTGY